MKHLIPAMVACAMASSVMALDTTISNDFWCTWNYPNRTNAVSGQAAVAVSALRSLVSTSLPSPNVEVFNTFPSGAIIIYR